MTEPPISRTLTILILAFVAAEVTARQDDPLVGPPVPKVPKMELSKPAWNFGSIDFGGVLKETFLVRNVGNADLVIRDVNGTCACTVANVSRFLIPPGESAEVTVQFDTTERQGQIVASINIISNDPSKSSAVFSVTGVVRRPIEIEPESITLSAVSRTTALSGSTTIRVNTPKPLVPRLTNSAMGLISAKLEEVTPGRVYKLTVKTRTAPPIGMTREAIVIETGYAPLPTVRVPVYINIQPRVHALPPAIYIPKTVETKSYRQVRVQYFGNRRDFRVTGVQSSHTSVSVELRSKRPKRVSSRRGKKTGPKLEQIVAIRLAPGAQLPDVVEIRITTNEPKFEVMKVRITNDPERYRALLDAASRGESEAPTSQPSTSQPSSAESQPTETPGARDASQRPTSP